METENVKLKLYENDTPVNLLTGVNENLEKLDSSIGALAETITKVNVDAENTDTAVQVIESSIQKINGDIQDLITSSNTLSATSVITNNKITVLETDLNALELSEDNRYQNLSNELTELNASLVVTESTLTSISNTVNLLVTKASSLETKADSLEDELEMATTDIQANETAIQGLSTTINQVSGVANSAKATVDGIITEYNANFSKIFENFESGTYDSFDLSSLPSETTPTGSETQAVVVLRLTVNGIATKSIIPEYFRKHNETVPSSMNSAVFYGNNSIPLNFYNVVGISKNLERDCFYVAISVNYNPAYSTTRGLQSEYIDFCYKVVDYGQE